MGQSRVPVVDRHGPLQCSTCFLPQSLRTGTWIEEASVTWVIALYCRSFRQQWSSLCTSRVQYPVPSVQPAQLTRGGGTTDDFIDHMADKTIQAYQGKPEMQ